MTTFWTDISLMHDVDDLVIARAVAAAMGVRLASVAIVPHGTDAAPEAGRVAEVVVQRQDLRAFGEGGSWPIALAITTASDRPVADLAALRAVAAGIGVPLIANIATDGQDMFRVVFPDGHAPVRLLDDDENPELTADDRRRLARYDQPARAA
jgi:hypothetical protein